MIVKPNVCATMTDILPEGISLRFVLFIILSISKSRRLFSTLDPATEAITITDPKPSFQV